MANFYSSKSSSGGGGGSSAPASTFDFGGGGPAKQPKPEASDPGKFSIDLGNIVGSVGDAFGSLGEFAGGIGIPGGPNIGDGLAFARDRVSSIGFGDGANLGALPGLAVDALGAPAAIVEGEIAENRLNAAQQGGSSPVADILAELGRHAFGSQTDALRARAQELRARGEPIPAELQKSLGEMEFQNQLGSGLTPEFQARLDAGESVDALAAEMTERGIGINNDPGANLAANLLLDPLNFIGPGIGKVGRAAKTADQALRAGVELGVGQRFMGAAYGAASRGLSAGGARFMDAALGPVTSGVFHAFGTKPYLNLKAGLGRLAPEYASAYDDALARGAAQLPRAIIARYMAEEAGNAIRRGGQAAVNALPADIGATIEARLGALRTIGPETIERRTQELLARVAPDFAGHTDEGRFVETRDKLAAITGMSPEDATRVLGSKADLRTAQHVHLAFYGKAGDDLGRAKAAAATAKNIDPERIVLIAPDTLTQELADKILNGAPELVDSAVEQYSILRNRFGATAYDHSKVRTFIEDMRDAFPQAVKAPVTGKNALPKSLKGWQKQYEAFGYKMGFAPKDGWKTKIDDATGEVEYADPFVHFVSEAEPLTVRNPLGRFMDGLFRGTTQTSIIQDSRDRMVQITRGSGISANQARAIHEKILNRAADEGVTPRGLAIRPQAFEEAFRDILGPQYDEFIQHVDPNFAVMKAFEGNLSRVGLTQKFTGRIKTATAGRGNVAAAISEFIYPKLRFTLSPLFQGQEFVESPFWNFLRGIRNRRVDPDVAKVYEELVDLPDFRYLTEAGYFLHLAGSAEVTRTMGRTSLLGRALARFPNVKAAKERNRMAQVFSEHGEAFEEAVNAIDPKFWRAMTEAYGTTDARQIADAFITERTALTSGEKTALRVFDASRPDSLIGADGETVWQAFRESFRQSSEQAFKTHYFNPTRGWLERTINHPYLGIYPASYMWGKVLPEFARFLLKRPFGLNAPLTGFAAYTRVQQAVLGMVATDPEFAKAIEDNSDLIYAVEMLLPGTPSNLPANAPAWARHLAEDRIEQRKIDPQTFFEREAKDSFGYAVGPVRTANVASGAIGDLGDIVGDIYANLTRSAEQYDAQFTR